MCAPLFHSPPLCLRPTVQGVARVYKLLDMSYGSTWLICFLGHKLDVLRAHCDDVGRDFNSIRKTLSIGTYIDKSHSRALEQAGLSNQDGKTATGRPLYNSDTAVIAGDPSAVREQYKELSEMGFDLIVTYFEDFQDLSAMKLFIDKVIPEFA